MCASAPKSYTNHKFSNLKTTNKKRRSIYILLAHMKVIVAAIFFHINSATFFQIH